MKFSVFQVVKETRKNIGKKRALQIKAEPDVAPASKISRPEMKPVPKPEIQLTPDKRSLMIEGVQQLALLPQDSLFYIIQLMKSINTNNKK